MSIYGPLKYVILVSLFSMMILTITPLIVFTYQILRDPRLFEIRVEEVTWLNEGMVSAKVVLHYPINISLSRVRVRLGSTDIIFENVVKGEVSRRITLTPSEVQSGISEIEVEVIPGLFKFKYTRAG
ncbi:MAG: hypothetical protein QXS79_00685 [Candidatus Bathyarchaeia archaeon]